MRYFVICLVLLACASAQAQPLPDPFVVTEADSGASFTGVRVTMRDSVTADIVYLQAQGIGNNRIMHAVVSLASEQVIAGPEELPCTHDWDLTLGDVASRGADGWVAITYEESPFWVGTMSNNRALLLWGNDTLTESTLLDTGYIHFPMPSIGDHSNTSFSLTPRQGGGWLASWINEGTWDNGQWAEPACSARVVTFDANLTMIADQFFAGGQVSPWGPMWVRVVSWSADSMLALLSWSGDPFLNWVPRTGEIPLAYPTSCLFSPLDFRQTQGGRLLACGTLLRPGLFTFELDVSGQCSLLDSTAFEGYRTFTCWHPDYGYAFLENYPNVVMLARVDTLGHAVQPPGCFYDGGNQQVISFSTSAIAPNGRVVVLWGERQGSDAACTTLKMAWVDWTTYLGVDDRDFIPHPSSLLLSSYPNPFNATTQLSFDLPRAGKVTLQVFNLLGREVSRLLDEPADAGTHHVTWNATGQPSGLYFARLTTSGGARTIKLCLTK